ncbi:MAG TPA: HDOD domain-containing protein [Candidatus Binatia bacterium]|nr:HDOD domain-containing protein [Candidatus Binatia bacterium]
MHTSARPAPDKPTDCLARQPILNKDERVLGYELLFRENADEERFSSDFDGGTRSIIDTLNIMGLDVVCDGRRAFINCTHDMLLKEFFLLLPAEKAVVEIQETVPADEAVMAACQQLKLEGYRIALDNFVLGDAREKLISYADYLKIDIRRVPQQHCAAIVANYGAKCTLVAQKVETRLQFITALKDGFTLFQGYFFHHPERMRARHIPANQASQLRLLKAVSAPEPNLDEIEELIKLDASLCYRLLRYLNSPLLGVSATVQSVRHGMRLLGERELVRWIRMATALIMGQEKCSDLVLSSLVRARFCELLAPKVNHGTCDLFLIGMFSLMDAILEVPMGVVIEGLAFDAETRTELLGMKTGKETALSPIYELMVAREAGEWDVVARYAKKLNLSLPFVNRAYNEAVSWAHQMSATREKQ